MTTDTVVIDNTANTITDKPKKKQKQPRYHALKSRLISKHRRIKIIEDCLNGVPRKVTAKALGLSEKTGSSQVSQILAEPNTKESFVRILEKSGLTDEKLSEKLKSLIEAKNKHFFANEGIVTDERESEAHETQRKTIELIARLKGHLKEKTEGDINIGLMQMVVHAVQNPAPE